MFDRIKKFIFNSAYLNLYPMTDKGQDICDQINNCNFEEDSELRSDIDSLCKYINSDLALNDVNSDTYNRELNGYYRTKRVKIRDEEQNKKVVEKVKVERKLIGYKQDIETYNNKLNDLEQQKNELYGLAEKILNQNIEVEDLKICDRVLKLNRIATRTYVAIVSVLAAFILCAVCLTFFV